MEVRIVEIDSLARNWWVAVARGVAGILFGLLTLIAPGISLASMVLVFGAYAFADGVLAIVMAVRRNDRSVPWWVLLLEGVAGIALGVGTFFLPGLTALALLYLVAGWALVTGVLEIVAAIRLRKLISDEWLLAVSGVLSVGLGVLLVLFPGPGALALVIWIGAYALLFGGLLVALGFRLRSWSKGAMSPSPLGTPVRSAKST
jgi:uncharacterized membrane protein HdeD (DUF308 family)